MSNEERGKLGNGLSRRDFMKLGGLAATVPAMLGPQMVEAAGEEVPVYGPGKVPISLHVNGKTLKAELEPRVTLLDALRQEFDLTGAKRVCDRNACGACTVLMDGKTVYACGILAIDAQGHEISTIEALGSPEEMSALQRKFVEHDAQQCGFCTPGFVIATKAFLDKHPKPSDEDIRRGLSGNVCRCGTYAGIRAAVHELAGRKES